MISTTDQQDKEWFAEWFDSPYYHILYKNRNDEEAQRFIDQLISYLKVPKGAKIVDMACGKGRHAKYLADKGFDVTGLDLSAQSIQAAKSFEHENLRFDVHDMREVYKKEHFEYFFSFFTSFGYFEDEATHLNVLKVFYQQIQPGGYIMLDFLNADTVAKNLVPKDVKVVEGIQFDIEKRIENQTVYKKISFEDKMVQEQVRMFRQAELELLFKNAGFTIEAIFGNYELSQNLLEGKQRDANKNDRMIIIAKR